jgi:hypothetical protein
MKLRNSVLALLGIILGCGERTDPREGTSKTASTRARTQQAEEAFSPNPQCTMPSTWDPVIGQPSAAALQQIAPTGALRVAVYYGNQAIGVCTPTAGKGCTPAFDPQYGVLSGTAVDLACRLQAQLKIPLVFSGYPTIAALNDGFATGTWEIGFGSDPSLPVVPGSIVSHPYIGIDNTLLVPVGSSFEALADLDKPGVTIAVQSGNTPDLFMRANFHNAMLVELVTNSAPNDIFPLVKGGACNTILCAASGYSGLHIDAAAGGRFGESSFVLTSYPGGRVLSPSLVLANIAPFIRPTLDGDASCYLADYIEAARASGLLEAIIRRLPFQNVGNLSCTNDSQCQSVGSIVESCSAAASGKCGLSSSFGRSVPPAQPGCAPAAKCHDVIVSADGSCHAGASINAGSDDADGDLAGCTQNPPGPYALGMTPVTLTCSDTEGKTASCNATVTVVDTTPPVITCPADQTMECTDEHATASFVATATDNCGTVSVRCTPTSGTTLPEDPGSTAATCVAVDSSGNQAACGFQIAVRDTLPPVVATNPGDANGFIASLWPPNHSYHTVSLSDCIAASVDQCDGTAVTSSIVGVSSDEAVKGNGSGDAGNDIVIAENGASVQLRAERDGSGDGRVYTIFAVSSDDDGNATHVSCKVQVPRDQSGAAAVDSGAAYCVGKCN